MLYRTDNVYDVTMNVMIWIWALSQFYFSVCFRLLRHTTRNPQWFQVYIMFTNPQMVGILMGWAEVNIWDPIVNPFYIRKICNGLCQQCLHSLKVIFQIYLVTVLRTSDLSTALVSNWAFFSVGGRNGRNEAKPSFVNPFLAGFLQGLYKLSLLTH